MSQGMFLIIFPEEKYCLKRIGKLSVCLSLTVTKENYVVIPEDGFQ